VDHAFNEKDVSTVLSNWDGLTKDQQELFHRIYGSRPACQAIWAQLNTLATSDASKVVTAEKPRTPVHKQLDVVRHPQTLVETTKREPPESESDMELALKLSWQEDEARKRKLQTLRNREYTATEIAPLENIGQICWANTLFQCLSALTCMQKYHGIREVYPLFDLFTSVRIDSGRRFIALLPESKDTDKRAQQDAMTNGYASFCEYLGQLYNQDVGDVILEMINNFKLVTQTQEQSFEKLVEKVQTKISFGCKIARSYGDLMSVFSSGQILNLNVPPLIKCSYKGEGGSIRMRMPYWIGNVVAITVEPDQKASNTGLRIPLKVRIQCGLVNEMYILRAVAIRTNYSTSSGHYIAWVNKNGNQYIADDVDIKQLDGNSDTFVDDRGTARGLFFEREQPTRYAPEMHLKKYEGGDEEPEARTEELFEVGEGEFEAPRSDEEAELFADSTAMHEPAEETEAKDESTSDIKAIIVDEISAQIGERISALSQEMRESQELLESRVMEEFRKRDADAEEQKAALKDITKMIHSSMKEIMGEVRKTANSEHKALSDELSIIRTFVLDNIGSKSSHEATAAPEAPVSASETVTPPVSVSDVVEPPVSASETVTPPVSVSDVVEPPVSASETIAPPVSASDVVESPVSASETVALPMSASEITKHLESVDDVVTSKKKPTTRLQSMLRAKPPQKKTPTSGVSPKTENLDDKEKKRQTPSKKSALKRSSDSALSPSPHNGQSPRAPRSQGSSPKK
jgi:hypothetical protein